MNKQDIIEALVRDAGVPRGRAAAAADVFVSEIRRAVARGERVHLRGLGTFERRSVPAKKARRPKENTPMIIPAHEAPHFRASQEFKDAVLEASADSQE